MSYCAFYCCLSRILLAPVVILMLKVKKVQSPFVFYFCDSLSDELINYLMLSGCLLSSTVRPQCMDWAVRWLAGAGLQAAASVPVLQIGHAMHSANTGEPYLSSAPYQSSDSHAQICGKWQSFFFGRLFLMQGCARFGCVGLSWGREVIPDKHCWRIQTIWQENVSELELPKWNEFHLMSQSFSWWLSGHNCYLIPQEKKCHYDRLLCH